MRATFRPLAAWPYPPRRRLSGQRFGNTGRARQTSPRDVALELLEAEVEAIKGSDVVIGLVVPEAAIGFSGALKPDGWKRVGHRGAEVSFAVPGGRRLVFYTDAFDDVVQNLRAIALGLEALRAVERYGISSSAGEQYAGFQMLEAGGDVDRGRKLVEKAGSVSAALKAHHPDTGGTDADFRAVQAFRVSQGDA